MAVHTPPRESLAGATNRVADDSPLVQLGRILAFLRLFSAVGMLAIFFLAQRAQPSSPLYGWTGTIGLLLLGYAGLAILWFILYRLRPLRLYTSVGLLLDFGLTAALALASHGLLFPFGSLPVLAVGISGGLWLGALAALLYCAANWVMLLDLAQGMSAVPLIPFGGSIFFALLLTVTYGVTLSGRFSRLSRFAHQSDAVGVQTLRQSLLAAYKVSNTLSSSLNPDAVLSSLFSEFAKVLPYSVGMALLNDSTANLYVAASAGLEQNELKRTLSGQQGAVARVMRTGQSVIVRGHLREQDAELTGTWARVGKCKSALIVPLRAAFEIYGVLLIASPESNLYDQEQLVLLEALANNATVALKNAQLYDALREERDKVMRAEAEARAERDKVMRAEAEARAERDKVMRTEAEVRAERDKVMRTEAEVRGERDRVISIQEEVRKSLARDLHDGPAQTLAAITMNLEIVKKMLESRPDPARVFAEFDNLIRLSRKANHDVRTTLFELRPLVLETKGLVAALEQYQQRFLPADGMTMLLDSSRYPGRQNEKVEATIFDIVQEAVGNAKKHAKARNVQVTLGVVGGWTITTIQDDGAGFDVAAVVGNYEKRGSFGLLNMRERTQALGGDLTIESAPGAGAKVTVQLPAASGQQGLWQMD